jgi:Fur family ferric uptake transcriptional regulator/Fur family peroxide stress response transcriptional regulator
MSPGSAGERRPYVNVEITHDGGTEHRLTPQRRAVLVAVRDSHDHLSASEIWERARALHPRISFATVYNAVRYLCDAGLLQHIPFGDGASLYDARTDRHDHAMCAHCGHIVDFAAPFVQDIGARAAKETGFVATEVCVTLRGICPDCQGRTKFAD